MYKFALIGAAGYVAPRHMKAIKENNCELVAAVDLHDSVGILDSYFPECRFFTEVERFDRHLEKLRRKGEGVDYVSICSPNYLHDAHCRMALRVGANAICEKPLVLNPWNLDQLKEIEKESERKIYNVLQLRVHPTIIELKERMNYGMYKEIDLKYITSRGSWYYNSWKGDMSKSGGIATNIGIHFFDMLFWIFGDVEKFTVTHKSHDKMKGILYFKRARVNWFLSTDGKDLPEGSTGPAYRRITIDGKPVMFDNVFKDLHTIVYEEILGGNGFGIEDCRKSIELVSKMR